MYRPPLLSWTPNQDLRSESRAAGAHPPPLTPPKTAMLHPRQPFRTPISHDQHSNFKKFSWRRLGNFMWLLTSEPDCRARVLKRERSREKEKWKREIAKVGSFYCCVVEVTLPLLLCSFSLSPYTLSFPLYTLNLSFPSSLRSCRLGPLLRCLALKSSSGARAFIFLTVSSIFLFPRRIHSISILCINFEK